MSLTVPRTHSYRRLGNIGCLCALLLSVVVEGQPVQAAQTLLSYQSDEAASSPAVERTPQPTAQIPARIAANRYAAPKSNSPPREVFRGNLTSETIAASPAVDSRRLASASSISTAENSPAARSKSPFSLPVGQLLSTAGAGLAIVVGLFLVCAWLWRGGKHNPNAALPQEAFQVLGRAPLVGRTSAQLIRVGNKLVLVAVTAEGLQPLTEITEPAEVDRLAGLCLGGSETSSTAEFQKILRKLAQEPAQGFLGTEAA